ncbi:hypothetical protein WJX72_001144 [[Myrmecia] bisecta]|uniref:Ferredoxin thioredoxin reductase alpha chain domain-containing protein n=1 Tax=[Myrmecia] bisecta TaxID=41462 RepID=A0AAW1Q1F8_9CHLO
MASLNLSTGVLHPLHSFKHTSCRLRQAPRPRQRQLRISALGSEELKAGIEAGTKVKVAKSVVVYHAPKKPELDLESMEGTVLEVIKEWKGKALSANLPYKTQFMLDGEDGGKAKKLLVHLTADEIQAV